MSRIGALTNLKAEIPLCIDNSFDFGELEISQEDRQKVIQAGAIIHKNEKNKSRAQREICKSFYDVYLILHGDGKFVEWYTLGGYDKDDVSEIMKRNELYHEFGYEDSWVDSLKNHAVKVLTHKNVPRELWYEIREQKFKTVPELKLFIHLALDSSRQIDNEIIPIEPESSSDEVLGIEPTNVPTEVFEDDFFNKINRVEEVKMHIKKCNSFLELKRQLSLASKLKRQLAEIEKLTQERMDILSQQNNERLF